MDTVYVVMGTTGQWSDRAEWPVIAYTDEADAKAHVLRASQRARELFVQYERWYNIPKGANEHDPFMQADNPGTLYFYVSVGVGHFATQESELV